jgi:hypothetical protein
VRPPASPRVRVILNQLISQLPGGSRTLQGRVNMAFHKVRNSRTLQAKSLCLIKLPSVGVDRFSPSKNAINFLLCFLATRIG